MRLLHDMSHRVRLDLKPMIHGPTCRIRQNLKMSDRLSPPKTPPDTIVYDIYWNMYHGWLPLLGGQSVPEGSRNPVVCV